MQVFEVKNSPCIQQNEPLHIKRQWLISAASLPDTHWWWCFLVQKSLLLTTHNHHFILKVMGRFYSRSWSSALWGSFNMLKTCLLYKEIFVASNRKHNLHYLTNALFLVAKTFTGRHALSLLKLHFSESLCPSLIYEHFLFSLVSIMPQHYQVPLTTWYML